MTVIVTLDKFNSQQLSQGVTHNVKFTFSIGDTTHGVFTASEQDQQNWWYQMQYLA